MANFLHTAFGDLGTGFPWSVRMVSTSADSEAAAEAAWHAGFLALWNTAGFLALMPTTTTFTGTSTSTANSTFHQTTKTSTLATVAGTSASPALPFQTSLIVTLRTAQATRWGRGRIYLPGLADSALATTGYVWSAAAMTAVQTALNNAFVQWTGPLQFQILHRRNTLTGPAANTLTPVSGADASNKPAVQRRRGDKFVPARTTITT